MTTTLPDANTWLISGLGNPGKQYAQTRHNAGFWVLDALAKRLNTAFKQHMLFPAHMVEVPSENTFVPGKTLWLQKPTTFMNLSGNAIKPTLVSKEIPPTQLLVVVDDVALPFGKIRVRGKGSSGGQNGLKSIIAVLGNNENFPRLRIGVGPSDEETLAKYTENDLADYVLGELTDAEQEQLPKILEASVEAIHTILNLGLNKAAERFNGRTF